MLTRRGFLPDDRQAVHEQRGHLDRLQVEHHLAGFHLGQVEDVVDEREQMFAAAEDVADELRAADRSSRRSGRRAAPRRSR